MAPAMDACSNHLDLATWVCHGCPMQGRATESTFSSPSVTSPGPFGGRKMELPFKPGGRSAPHLTTHRVVPLRNAFAWRRPPKRCRSVDYKMALARGSGRPNAKRLAPRPKTDKLSARWTTEAGGSGAAGIGAHISDGYWHSLGTTVIMSIASSTTLPDVRISPPKLLGTNGHSEGCEVTSSGEQVPHASGRPPPPLPSFCPATWVHSGLQTDVDMRNGKDEKMDMDVCQARPVWFKSMSMCCPSAMPGRRRISVSDCQQTRA